MSILDTAPLSLLVTNQLLAVAEIWPCGPVALVDGIMRFATLLLGLAIVLASIATTRAEIVCTERGGCFETEMKIISNGGVYRGLEHKPRLISRTWENEGGR
jgi:hypothetical protein